MRSLAARLGREPVLIGAAFLAWVDVAHPSDLVRVALGATVAVFVRAYSSPKAAVEEARQDGRASGIADIASLKTKKTGAAAPR